MERRKLLIGLAAAVVGSGFVSRVHTLFASFASGPARAPGAVRTGGTGPVRSVSIRPVPLGAGGFICEVDQSADGTRFLCRTDVCNAYVRDAEDAAWRPLFSPTTMLPADYDPLPAYNGKADGHGVAGIRIAPSDRDILYASYHGHVWRSTDGGRSIRRTALPQKTMWSNSGVQRIFNRSIDVHPHHAGHVIAGSWGDGTHFSTDGGAHWRPIALPPTLPSLDGQPGLSLVLFGPDGRSVYVFVSGVGLFASATGVTGAFSAIPDGPARCSALVAGRDGAVHLCEYTGSGTSFLWRYHPEQGWSTVKTAQEMIALAVDPADPDRLFASGPYGSALLSTDGGRTLAAHQFAYSKAGSEVAWIADLKTLVVGHVLWDVRGEDRLCYATGVGVIRADLRTGMLTDWSAGIEELIGIAGVSVPDGGTVLTAWDKPFWLVGDEDSYSNGPVYPAEAGKPVSVDPVTHGTSIDHAADDPRFLVGVVNGGAMFGHVYGPGYSEDGGKTWTRFAGTPPKGWGAGGTIAASTRENIVLLPSDNGFGAYTLDGGRRWDTIRLDGRTETSGFANGFFVNRRNLTADKTRKGVFALVYTVVGGEALDNPLGGLWLTEDGGRSWRQRYQGLIGGRVDDPALIVEGQDRRQFWQCQLGYVPGRRGELVYTPHSDHGGDRLWWSGDDGASWRELHPSVRTVTAFGFGRAAAGQARPSFYFYGMVDGVTGLFASFDWFATPPVLLSRHPSPQLADIACIVGDANRFGRVWIGTGGAGWLVADIALRASGGSP